ncbi:MAG TPA: MarR family transcriptional regulator [Microthrixaceae bacterium]|nr:MarR family transcriptional regulator [Microthrixaceae bacterium]
MPSGTPMETNTRRIGHAWLELSRGSALHALRRHLYGHLVEAAQSYALDVLTESGPVRMSELAERLGVDPSTATRTVTRLEQGDYARRVTSPDDGRSVLVEITDHGQRTFDAVRDRRSKLLHSALEGFDAVERETLADLLERFVDGVAAYSSKTEVTQEP